MDLNTLIGYIGPSVDTIVDNLGSIALLLTAVVLIAASEPEKSENYDESNPDALLSKKYFYLD
jgi:hypothetical protein